MSQLLQVLWALTARADDHSGWFHAQVALFPFVYGCYGAIWAEQRQPGVLGAWKGKDMGLMTLLNLLGLKCSIDVLTVEG